ncbi:MAG: 16S rRNA (cytidine(1402)-2'-O)-methyltransferase [Bacilli bacterium]|nr:16S rRNA (cytidine(1402)-2'-O)-methyltransferase [Bacilli bacterium]
MSQKSYNGSPTLYFIPTPIGNLEDITIRAINTLKMVDFILCEDTRVTSILLNKYEIKKSLVRCDEYSQNKLKEQIIQSLSDGKNIGFVSDAGSPIVSDPGYIVAKYVIDAGYNVVALPGSTAFVPALSVSGINPSPFIFYGFLSDKVSKQKKELELLKSKTETLIFYVSVHDVKSTLNSFYEILGDRKIAICRELTKIHEEIIRGTIRECLNDLSSLKGEFVIIVEGNTEITDFSNITIEEHVNIFIEDGMSKMDAIKKVAKERGVSKSIVYNEYNKINK